MTKTCYFGRFLKMWSILLVEVFFRASRWIFWMFGFYAWPMNPLEDQKNLHQGPMSATIWIWLAESKSFWTFLSVSSGAISWANLFCLLSGINPGTGIWTLNRFSSSCGRLYQLYPRIHSTSNMPKIRPMYVYAKRTYDMSGVPHMVRIYYPIWYVSMVPHLV